MSNSIELIREAIASMQEVMDQSLTQQNIKDALQQPLGEAQKQLAEIESDKS
jgi:hypothetical protein